MTFCVLAKIDVQILSRITKRQHKCEAYFPAENFRRILHIRVPSSSKLILHLSYCSVTWQRKNPSQTICSSQDTRISKIPANQQTTWLFFSRPVHYSLTDWIRGGWEIAFQAVRVSIWHATLFMGSLILTDVYSPYQAGHFGNFVINLGHLIGPLLSRVNTIELILSSANANSLLDVRIAECLWVSCSNVTRHIVTFHWSKIALYNARKAFL